MDDFKNLCNNFSDQTLKIENFIAQNKMNFSDLTNQFKNTHQDILNFKNELDTAIQQIEIEIERNQNLLAKWVSGANTKLLQEQIAQKRIALTNQAQKINDSFAKLSQQIDRILNDFNTSSQQITIDLKNTENQLQTISKANQAGEYIFSASDDTTYHLQQNLQQVIDTLNSAQQTMEQQKVFNEISKSIDSLLQ
ncbi:conserved protein of unknown function [Tepidanaerobacter acetatoxydans Re1]|uniref:Uncharacterized protein n=1 Tax=Tepidanaerobacter acetatoxydans (strain DSM 21804 / JCM 16047 / Re1) TaxID=1209989 RepID=F4LWI3_TEPAE|nr:hypothetical protein [Tepidanaerobacter acetatoxydans]AEE90885.1 hypothetical protein TepRe1_0698 [Tepidanaerobacter acetatoxydans Re1]CCP25454.1 conserved protein of unknown function [Tepidanaerobacter acetatoxydans Re1]